MKATPGYGWPYPESGDHTRTWEYWQNLAQAIETTLQAKLTAIRSAVHSRSFTTGTWSLPNGAYSAINWQNGGAAAFTTPVPAVYLLAGVLVFTGNATGNRTLLWDLDGVSITGGWSHAIGNAGTAWQVLAAQTVAIELPAGKNITLKAYQSSGIALNVGAISGYTSGMTIAWTPTSP